MSNLSELLPAGAGAKSADFVASGTLGSGVTVALKADGTVEAVQTVSASAGTPVVFESADTARPSGTFDSSNNKVVVAYEDAGNSYYGTAVVGTVSGTSISFGSPVVYESASSFYNGAAFDSNSNKVVIAYRDSGNSGYGTAIVGTVSGTSISFGSPVIYEYGTSNFNACAFDSTSNKIVIAYADASNANYGTAVVGTVSGTSISFGTPVVFESNVTGDPDVVFDPSSNKTVICFSNSYIGNGKATVGTVSGSSISFGSTVTFDTSNASYLSAAFDSSSNSIVIAYRKSSGTIQGAAVVGTVSGTSISFGSVVTFTAGEVNYTSAAFDSSTNKVVIAYSENGNGSRGTAIEGTVSGTSISFGTPVVFTTGAAYYQSCTFDPNANKTVIAYADIANSGYGKSVVFNTSGSNNTSFIGITDQAIANTATGAVIVQGGVSDKLSGLTVGADYYVQADGSLTSDFIPYDISGPTYVQNFSVAAQETAPSGMAFNTDGTKMFICGFSGDDVNEYVLSTGFDVSTASYSQNFSVASQDTFPFGMTFNTSGTKMFLTGNSGQDINEYTLATGFDVSTASFVDSFSVAAQDTNVRGLAFNTAGTKMFICGAVGQNVYEYALATSFDVSTASYTQSFSVASQETSPIGITFNLDGTKMFIVGEVGGAVNEYALTTGFDVSTASYVQNFSVAAQEAAPAGIVFSTDGTKMFICGYSGDDVNQYSTTAASTTVPAGRALSSTSILLEG